MPGSMFSTVSSGRESVRPAALPAGADADLIRRAHRGQVRLPEGRDHPARLAPLADHHAAHAGRAAGPYLHLVADAGVDGQRVPGGRVGVHEAGAGGGVIGAAAEDGVTEVQAEDDAAIADRQVRAAVAVHAVRAVAELGMLDHAQQVDRNRPGREGLS
jgi:hypothetical protein